MRHSNTFSIRYRSAVELMLWPVLQTTPTLITLHEVRCTTRTDRCGSWGIKAGVRHDNLPDRERNKDALQNVYGRSGYSGKFRPVSRIRLYIFHQIRDRISRSRPAFVILELAFIGVCTEATSPIQSQCLRNRETVAVSTMWYSSSSSTEGPAKIHLPSRDETEIALNFGHDDDYQPPTNHLSSRCH